MLNKTDILDFDKKYGFVQVPNVLIENLGKLRLSGNEFTFLVIIRMFARQKDCAFPSLKTLQRISGVSTPTIINIMKSLENKGYLIIKRSPQENNLYSFKPLNDILEKIIKNNLNGVLKNFNYPTKEILVPLLKKFNPKNKHIKNKHIKTHTQKEESVCEDEIQKIKNTKTFQNIEPATIENLIKKNGKEAVIAANYIEKTFSGQAIRNPAGLLISTLQKGLYSELPAENRKCRDIKADIERLNEKYKGFVIFNGEKIKEILNIGGRIAFHTDNCLREIILAPAKSYDEFVIYLSEFREEFNTS